MTCEAVESPSGVLDAESPSLPRDVLVLAFGARAARIGAVVTVPFRGYGRHPTSPTQKDSRSVRNGR